MEFASLILARKNSNRLFQKNKRKFLGMPLFLHQIKLSKEINEIKKIFISTDDEDIQSISKEYNIEILKRNPKFASDKCSLEKTILADIKKIKSIDKKISHLVVLSACNPMFSQAYIKEGIKKIKKNKFNSIQTYVEKKNFEIGVDSFDNIRKNTQDLKPKKIETGFFWIINIEKFLLRKNRIIKPVGYVKILDEDYVDIDTIEDFLLAEKKLKFKYYKNTDYYFKKRLSKSIDFNKYQSETSVDPDGKIRNPFEEKDHKIEFFKDEINYVNKLEFKNKPKLLDLGCGTGFVTSAISKKYEKYGLEVGRDSYNFAKKYFNKMHLGALKKSTYKNNFFDVILLLHVLEHVKNPIELLETIINILNPAGKLIIGTPNFDSACARRYGKKFRMLNDKTHISLFSDHKLVELLSDIGYEVEKVDFPYFETKYFNTEEILKIFDKNTMSPAFYGSIMTIYVSKK